jgi:hypothetical protein
VILGIRSPPDIDTIRVPVWFTSRFHGDALDRKDDGAKVAEGERDRVQRDVVGVVAGAVHGSGTWASSAAGDAQHHRHEPT